MFGGTKPQVQRYSLRNLASPYPVHRYSVNVAVGRGTRQRYSIRVTRQIVIEEPADSVVSINCPVGPVT